VPATVHWFRRDLRLTANTALYHATRSSDRVVCVYVLSSWKNQHSWTGSFRQTFLCESLQSLSRNLASVGGELIIRCGDPVDELLKLVAETGAIRITFNKDPDPHGRHVEDRLSRESGSILVEGFEDIQIFPPQEVLTKADSPFRVYSPYARAWRQRPLPEPVPRITSLNGVCNLPSLDVPNTQHWKLAASTGHLPGGEKAARQRLKAFLSGPIAEYGATRNIPSAESTSRLSQDLRLGLLSPLETYVKSEQVTMNLPATARKNAATFLNELIWREFYLAILWHWPEVLEHEFNPQFRGLPWEHDPAAFERWTHGETGFPIVDASMRQLRQTGYMHNRCRMIVAMFLTKDLHIDWRMGEKHFMQLLIDGEIGSNNGGWQWSAGTGADAAPYFRIQNPWSQTARFDPEGEFIRRWVPELRDVPAANLAHPPETPLAPGYPLPMVDHATERDRTMEIFSTYKEQASG